MTSLGSIRPDGARRAIRFERRYTVPPGEVWAALTEPERLARWLAPAEIEPRAGGRLRIDFGNDVVTGDVLRFEPPALLEVEWRFAGEDESVLRFELAADGDGTLLVLEHLALGDPHATGYGAGWHAHLDLLEALLAGRTPGSWDARFAELLPRYREVAAASLP